MAINEPISDYERFIKLVEEDGTVSQRAHEFLFVLVNQVNENLRRIDANVETINNIMGRLGLNQDQVDARVRELVADFAEEGDDSEVPVDKVPNLPVDKVPNLPVDKVPNLPASRITNGVFETERIPDLDASKIASGELAEARIPDTITRNRELGTMAGQNANNVDIDGGSIAENTINPGSAEGQILTTTGTGANRQTSWSDALMIGGNIIADGDISGRDINARDINATRQTTTPRIEIGDRANNLTIDGDAGNEGHVLTSDGQQASWAAPEVFGLRSVRTFRATDTPGERQPYIKTPGTNYILVDMWGAGAGGAGYIISGDHLGNSGGAGGWGRSFYDIRNDSITMFVIVGIGGLGTENVQSGEIQRAQSGGFSEFIISGTTNMRCLGGVSGAGGDIESQSRNPGAGGFVNGANVVSFTGGDPLFRRLDNPSYTIPGWPAIGGAGTSSFGLDTRLRIGGGGIGGRNPNNGGSPGGDGYCIIYEYR